MSWLRGDPPNPERASVWQRHGTNGYPPIRLAICIPCKWVEWADTVEEAENKRDAHNESTHGGERRAV